KTRAEDQGDHFVVNGQKIWTSSGPIADWGILLCRTDSKVPKHKGISCFLLNMRQPGVEVRPLKQITGSSLFSEVFMTNARAVRAKMGRIYADLEVQRYAALRVLSALQKGDPPGAGSSITKLSYTEFEKRYYELALEILGPEGQLLSPLNEFDEIDTSSGEP